MSGFKDPKDLTPKEDEVYRISSKLLRLMIDAGMTSVTITGDTHDVTIKLIKRPAKTT